MSDYEMLSIILMILSIIVSILLAYINNVKKYPPTPMIGHFFIIDKLD